MVSLNIDLYRSFLLMRILQVYTHSSYSFVCLDLKTNISVIQSTLFYLLPQTLIKHFKNYNFEKIFKKNVMI